MTDATVFTRGNSEHIVEEQPVTEAPISRESGELIPLKPYAWLCYFHFFTVSALLFMLCNLSLFRINCRAIS